MTATGCRNGNKYHAHSDLQSLHNRVSALELFQQSVVQTGLGFRRSPAAEYERTNLLATGGPGLFNSSSVMISLEDVGSIWLEQLLEKGGGGLNGSGGGGGGLNGSVEGSGLDLRVAAPEYHDKPGRSRMAFPEMSLFMDDRPQSSMNSNSTTMSEPRVTLQLIDKLPDAETRNFLLGHLEGTMRMHPSFNFPTYRRRVEAMFDRSLYTSTSPSGTSGGGSPKHPNPDGTEGDASARERPSLMFFAAAVGGLALGARTAAMALASSASSSSKAAGFGVDGSSVRGSSPPQPGATAPSPPIWPQTTASSPLGHSTSTGPAQTQTHGSSSSSFPSPASRPLPVSPPAASLTSPPQAHQRPPPTPTPTPHTHTSATLTTLSTLLFTLSKQALAVSEFETHYDLDFIAATILHGLFLLYDGKARVAHTIYPTMGKLVNVARGMGLHLDPDEFGDGGGGGGGLGGGAGGGGGKYSLFDAEARRRAWWDVYYYDL